MLKPITQVLPPNPSEKTVLTLMLDRATHVRREIEQWIVDVESYEQNTGRHVATPAQMLDMRGTLGQLKSYMANLVLRIQATKETHES